MRHNLITHFYCSNCGEQLSLKTEDEANAKPKPRSFAGEPTGAACIHTGFMVEPCRACIAKYTEPAKQLASAISALGSVE